VCDALEHLTQALADRYAVERELGAGGMATVYLAEDLKHKRKVAIKVLRPELVAALGSERFLREIEITASLNHPHILPLLDSGSAVGQYGGPAVGETVQFLYYVMPYVEGESLRDRLNRETELSIDDALKITEQVASALDYAHRRDVIHRDIKPENILLHEGEAMVADFGIALAVSAAGGHRLTETGLSLGTPEYMSPEQAAADQIDARSDQYALACVLYEMLAGEPPYTGRTAQAVIAKRFSDPVPSVKRLRAQVPDIVNKVLLQALSRTPADRFESLKAFADTLWAETRSVALAGGYDPARPSEPPPHLSVAVLPFQNISADPENEYFSDGITEELLNTLAKVPGFHVAARTSSFSFKGKTVPVAEIGEALRVAHVVEGSVRKAGNRVRVTAQLISAENGYHLWSESYERDLGDIFALQREIAEAIGGALEAGLTRGWDAGLSAEKSVVTEAYDLYLRGRFFLHRMTREDLERSLQHFHEALELDPTLALAHSGICKAYGWLADAYMPPREAAPKALAAAEKAVELDPTSAEAYSDLGMVLSTFEWRWAESEEALRRALELNPNLPEAWIFSAWNCFALRDRNSAVPLFERGFNLDPLSGFASMMLGWGYAFGGRYDDAIRQWNTTQELSPGLVYIDSTAGIALRELGQYEEALHAFEEVESTLKRPSTGKAITLARMGRIEEARRVSQELEAAFEREYFLPEFLAEVFVALGDADRAIYWLERGLEERSSGVERLRVAGFEPLFDDPRFLDILERAGLPPPPETDMRTGGQADGGSDV